MKKIVFVLCMLVLLGSASLVAQATTVNVSEDAYLDGWLTDMAMGAEYPQYGFVGIWEEGRTRIGLLKFNLPTDIVTAATLNIYVDSVLGQDGVSSYIAEALPNSWSESTTTAINTWPLIAPLWADGICSDTKEISKASAGTWVQYDVTSAVQAAGSGATISFYIAIDHYKPMVGNAFNFVTKEANGGVNAATLSLTTVPEPSSLVGLSAALVGLCGLIKRRR